jgi:hypothetical protein
MLMEIYLYTDSANTGTLMRLVDAGHHINNRLFYTGLQRMTGARLRDQDLRFPLETSLKTVPASLDTIFDAVSQ